MRHTIPVMVTALSIVAADLAAAELTVRVEGIPSTAGRLLLSVAASSEAWDGQAAPAAAQRVPVQDTSAEIVFSGLAPGRYAVAVIHDANDNGKLDTNPVGMPIEAYGFSNSPDALMRKATFEEAALELPEDGIVVTVNLD